MAAPAYLLTPPVLDRRITLDPGEVAPTGDTYRYDVQWTSVNGVTRFGRYYVEAGRLVLNSVDADRADLPEFNVDDVLTFTWGGYSLSVTLTVVDFVRGGVRRARSFPRSSVCRRHRPNASNRRADPRTLAGNPG